MLGQQLFVVQLLRLLKEMAVRLSAIASVEDIMAPRVVSHLSVIYIE
jgi:hypothetical protein